MGLEGVWVLSRNLKLFRNQVQFFESLLLFFKLSFSMLLAKSSDSLSEVLNFHILLVYSIFSEDFCYFLLWNVNIEITDHSIELTKVDLFQRVLELIETHIPLDVLAGIEIKNLTDNCCTFLSMSLLFLWGLF